MNTTITGIYPIDKEEKGEQGTWKLQLHDRHLYYQSYQEYEDKDEDLGIWKEKKLEGRLVAKYEKICFVYMFWSNKFELWTIAVFLTMERQATFELYYEDKEKCAELFEQIKEKYLKA